MSKNTQLIEYLFQQGRNFLKAKGETYILGSNQNEKGVSFTWSPIMEPVVINKSSLTWVIFALWNIAAYNSAYQDGLASALVEFGQDCTDSDLQRAVGSAMKKFDLMDLLHQRLSAIGQAINNPTDQAPKGELILKRDNLKAIISMAV